MWPPPLQPMKRVLKYVPNWQLLDKQQFAHDCHFEMRLWLLVHWYHEEQKKKTQDLLDMSSTTWLCNELKHTTHQAPHLFSFSNGPKSLVSLWVPIVCLEFRWNGFGFKVETLELVLRACNIETTKYELCWFMKSFVFCCVWAIQLYLMSMGLKHLSNGYERP